MADVTNMLPVAVCLDDRAHSRALHAHGAELRSFFGRAPEKLARVSVAVWMSLRPLSDEYIEQANRVQLGDIENAANEVYAQLREDYPARALTWVPTVHWDGPHPVEISALNFADQEKWKASRDDIGPYAQRIAQGRMKPVILARCPGEDKLLIVDGHHRTLAYKHLGIPVLAYVADLKTEDDAQRARELHAMQKSGSSKGSFSAGSIPSMPGSIPDAFEPSPEAAASVNATEKDPSAQPNVIIDGRPALIDAAFGVIFGETGNNGERKVLCVSRPEPPHEFALPGGMVESGESPAQACVREIREEVGLEASELVWFGSSKSPVDGRTVHWFSIGKWTGTPSSADKENPSAKIAWLTPDELLDQSVLYKRSVWEMMAKGLLHSRRTVAGYQDDAHEMAIKRPGPGRPKTLKFQGLPIVITRPKGTKQTGMGLDGKAWSRTYHTDYGHIATGYGQSAGKLGVYVGADSASPHVFWVTQKNDAGGFDEFKLFVGYRTAGEASAEYARHTPAKYFGSIHQGTVQQMLAALGKRLASDAVQLDLGPADVHRPGAGGTYRKGKTPQMAEITTKKRNALPDSQFALPSQRKFPIHDAAHVRNAAARLAQAVKAGKISSADAATARAAIKRAAKKFGIDTSLGGKRAQRLTVRAQLGPGGALHIRHHLSDIAGGKVVAFPSLVTLRGEVEADDLHTMADGPVWIQVAKQGKFEGHSAGPFEMNADTFGQIIANFKATKNRAIPVDFEHASEQDPTLGSIPNAGAPAQGWIKDLKVGADGNLYGLVEWGQLAREYITQGKYKFFSPAIRFNSRDRVTGKPIGARMTSGALTNQPFLDGMAPMVARDFGDAGTGPAQQLLVACRDGGALMPVYDDVPVVEMAGYSAALVHSPAEYMPAIRSALSMHPMAPASECADRLENLYDHMVGCGFDHTAKPQGIDLATPCGALRDMVGAKFGDDWHKVFDVVRGLIAAAIEEHEIADHGAEMDDDETIEGQTGDDDLFGTDVDSFADTTPQGSAAGTPAGTQPPGASKSGASSPAGSAGMDDAEIGRKGDAMNDTLGPRGDMVDAPVGNADVGNGAEMAGNGVVVEDDKRTMPAPAADPTSAPVAADDVDGPSGDVDGPSGGVDSMRTNSLGGLTRPSPSTGETYTMSQIDVTAALKDASEKATALAGENSTLKGEVTTLKAENEKLKASDAEASLKLKDLAGQVEKLTADNKALSEAAAARAEADLNAKVEAAFQTYKDKKNLNDADKAGMLIVARHDVAKFDAMYPAVPLSEQHLLRTHTTDRPAGAPTAQTSEEVPAGGTVTLTRRQLTKKLMREKGVPFDQAIDMADRIISKARRSGK